MDNPQKNIGHTVGGFAFLLLLFGVFIFLPVRTLYYWQGLVYILVFFLCAGLITVYLYRKDPKLLARRSKGGPAAEKETRQKIIQSFASLSLLVLYLLSSFDHYYGWAAVPLPVILIGDALTVFGFYIVFIVFRANTFTAATIDVEEGQTVISTGPYAFVRHPMYAGALIMLFGSPLALGSYYGLLAFLPFIFIIVWRLLAEEKTLSQNLKGYEEYKQKVRYRLVPFVW